MRIQVDTWLQRFLSLFGLVFGVELDNDDKHVVAVFIRPAKDFYND